MVIGPSEIPVIVDKALARDMPELGVLSMLAHGRSRHATSIARAVFQVESELDEARTARYNDVIYAFASEAARRVLEELMNLTNYQWQSPFAIKYVGIGREEGREEGLKKGREEGIRISLLRILEARGLQPSEAIREQIGSCQDSRMLEAWLCRAAVATDIREVFGP